MQDPDNYFQLSLIIIIVLPFASQIAHDIEKVVYMGGLLSKDSRFTRKGRGDLLRVLFMIKIPDLVLLFFELHKFKCVCYDNSISN